MTGIGVPIKVLCVCPMKVHDMCIDWVGGLGFTEIKVDHHKGVILTAPEYNGVVVINMKILGENNSYHVEELMKYLYAVNYQHVITFACNTNNINFEELDIFIADFLMTI